ncbi:MFS domain-containing protein [Mycena venus]|uniref:MFS domain-containing protein n=1 Tax=Mycena venus TaxID=2733690 RepID=A0A8H6YGE7_9AGAR|nr:MFS domain-containing protein [Mycena venus]
MDIPPSPPSPAPPKRSSWRAVAIAGTCTAAMLVNSSNNTSVAIALPTIGAALHARAAALQWLVSAYPLSSGCLLLFCGHIADVHGRKRVFVVGSAILAAFTLGCGFVHDEVTLAVLRGFQGIGGAATIPAAVIWQLGILAHEFPPSSGRARAAAFSSFSAGAPIGGALGMVLGGLVTQLSKYTWRAQFFLSAAIAFATLLVGILVIPPDAPLRSPPSSLPSAPPAVPSASNSEPKPPSSAAHTYPPERKEPEHPPPPRDTRTDWPGAFLSAAGLILLVFVLGQGSGPGVPPPRMVNMDFRRPFPPRGEHGHLFAREYLATPSPAQAQLDNFILDADADSEDQMGDSKSRPHPWHEHYHHHHHPPPLPPPSPPGGFLNWLFAAGPPPPHPHPPRHDDAFELEAEGDEWYIDIDGDLEEEGVHMDVGPHPHPHPRPRPHPPHHGPHAEHHHHHHHEHHGPHPHHGHGPHRHPPPPRQGLGAIIDWLTGRPPRPPHRHGPRDPPPPPPGGGPPWGGMIPHPPPMHDGGQAWGMAYIISLLVISLLLLALFALWEYHLERVHSRPGGALYDASMHPPQHAQDASDDAADIDHPRRSSSSSSSVSSRPIPGPTSASKPRASTLSNNRFVRALKSNSFVGAALAYAPPPLLPPSLFARRKGRVGVIYGIALLQFGAFMIWAFWVQLYYQIYIGYSPVRTVVRLTPMFVTGLICNVVVALIVQRVPTLWLLASGTLTTTVAPLLFALIVPSAPYWAFGFPCRRVQRRRRGLFVCGGDDVRVGLCGPARAERRRWRVSDYDTAGHLARRHGFDDCVQPRPAEHELDERGCTGGRTMRRCGWAWDSVGSRPSSPSSPSAGLEFRAGKTRLLTREQLQVRRPSKR